MFLCNLRPLGSIKPTGTTGPLVSASRKSLCLDRSLQRFGLWSGDQWVDPTVSGRSFVVSGGWARRDYELPTFILLGTDDTLAPRRSNSTATHDRRSIHWVRCDQVAIVPPCFFGRSVTPVSRFIQTITTRSEAMSHEA